MNSQKIHSNYEHNKLQYLCRPTLLFNLIGGVVCCVVVVVVGVGPHILSGHMNVSTFALLRAELMKTYVDRLRSTKQKFNIQFTLLANMHTKAGRFV